MMKALMKLIILPILMLSFLSSVSAKMESKVKLTKIHSVVIEDDKIIIEGDGVFRSRLVTTEEGKDSDFVINGKPSVEYEARAHYVKFVLTRYRAVKIKPTFSEEVSGQVKKTNAYMAGVWTKSVERAKLLKEGGEVSFKIKGEEVIFKHGRLISVKGRGSL